MIAEDEWGTLLFEASFGGVRIDVLSTEVDLSRALAESKTPYRDGASYQDTGGEPWVSACQVIFLGEGHKARFDQFLAQVNRAKPLLFVHPIFGTRYCRVGQCRMSASAEPRDTIIVDATFHEDSEPQVVAQPGAEMSVEAGVEDVRAIGEATDDELLRMGLVERDASGDLLPFVGVRARDDGELLNLSPETPRISRSTLDVVTGWARAGRTATRGAARELGAINSAIDRATEEYRLATDIKMYPLARELVRLRASVRKTYVALATTSSRLIEVRVTVPQPVLTVATRMYGAREAQARAQEIVEINRLRNPARVEQGTVLKAHSPSRSPSRPRRAA